MMRAFEVLAIATVIGVVASAAEDKIRSFQFKKQDVGKVPSGWKADQTKEGKNSSIWKVVADKTAPSKSGFALAQTAQSPGKVFNLCVVEDSSYQDLEASVAFKAVRGEDDQGGGIVWRYQDANNYYIARMNPLEDNYRLYKVVAGDRKELKRKEKLKVKVGTWHTLKIKQKGDHIECFLDGKKMLDARDKTFTKAGQVGLWTKADAQTNFDEFKVKGK